MMKLKPLLFCIVPILMACENKPKPTLKTFSWVCGTWANYSDVHAVFESWHTDQDGSLRGMSYAIDKTDTLLFETIRLIAENGNYYYLPTVPNQNAGKEIRFTLQSFTDTSFLFVNPEHDFPQNIAYYQIGKDSSIAILSGLKNGIDKQYSFPMKRIGYE